jgi:hypothetical protein
MIRIRAFICVTPGSVANEARSLAYEEIGIKKAHPLD